MNVAVIGAGVVGLSVACQLAADGQTVTVVDRAGIGEGASTRNAGWIVPVLCAPVPRPGMIRQSLKWISRADSPLSIRPSLAPGHLRFLLRMAGYCTRAAFERGLEAMVELAAGADAAFEELYAVGVRPEVHKSGLLMLFRGAQERDRWLYEAAPLERIGRAPVRVSRDEAKDLEPTLNDAASSAVWCPEESYVEPGSLVDQLERYGRGLGIDFLTGDEVIGLRRKGDYSVRVCTRNEEVVTEAVVIAAGAWTGHVASMAGATLPIRPGKGYGMDYPRTASGVARAVYIAEERVAVSPMVSGVRLSGTMEFGGFDQGVDLKRAAAIAAAAHRYLRDWSPQLDSPKPWSGLRPMTPDGLPVLGRIPGTENLIVASGHGMLGVTLGPVSGVIIKRVLGDAIEPSLAHAFGPGRFARGSLRARPRPINPK